jgi:Glycosyl hydrolase family 3 C-terminal domain
METKEIGMFDCLTAIRPQQTLRILPYSKNLTAWHNGDNLVSAVASRHNNTIVIVHSTGPVLMPWALHENITAILWAGVPGQEAGNSLADILYGTWNPSGRLPFTIARQESDYGARIQYGEQVVTYSEGLNVDYRWFDAHGIDPLFEFGFGLSYSAFEYSRLEVEGNADDGTEEGTKWKKGEAVDPPGTVGASVRKW